jgi:hypothetical protein
VSHIGLSSLEIRQLLTWRKQEGGSVGSIETLRKRMIYLSSTRQTDAYASIPQRSQTSDHERL